MNHYDPENTRYIDLLFIKDRIDVHIKNLQCKIRLVSKVKEICEEAIVEMDEEEADELSGKSIIRRRKVEIPDELYDLAVDFYAGACTKLNFSEDADPVKLFNRFSREGVLT